MYQSNCVVLKNRSWTGFGFNVLLCCSGYEQFQTPNVSMGGCSVELSSNLQFVLALIEQRCSIPLFSLLISIGLC